MKKLSQFTNSTANVFVLIDESEQSIEDGTFGLYPAPQTQWLNFPSDRHNQSANLPFADGHAQKWKWRYKRVFSFQGQSIANAEDLADLQRLQRAIPSCAPIRRGSEWNYQYNPTYPPLRSL